MPSPQTIQSLIDELIDFKELYGDLEVLVPEGHEWGSFNLAYWVQMNYVDSDLEDYIEKEEYDKKVEQGGNEGYKQYIIIG